MSYYTLYRSDGFIKMAYNDELDMLEIYLWEEKRGKLIGAVFVEKLDSGIGLDAKKGWISPEIQSLIEPYRKKKESIKKEEV